ncbi:MAG: hypothetical protein JWL69_1468 [Phycisphaerales bacterium]|nr:hypothetical protein [Phycisphaerales bacterium]
MQFGNHTSKSEPRERSKGWLKNRLSAAVAAAALAVTGLAATSHADTAHFDWSIPTDTDPNYTPSPFLSDTNFSQVAAFLTTYHAANPNAPLAVKVISPLTSTGAKAIFNTFPIKFVFADFEDTNAVSKTAALATIVKSSTSSKTAFVGNFNTYNVSNVAGSTLADPTRPTGTPANGAQSFQNILVNKAPFGPTTMVNPAAYPGAPDYKTQPSQSFAPNIRSALFVLPVDRVTFATLALTPTSGGATAPPSTAGGVNIPWVARFNNWGNSLLDTDHNSANGYQFVQNAGNPSNGQLLSRGDFSAQVLTYRLRGAYSYSLFNYYNPNAPANQSPYSSVVGYTPTQERSDAFKGWNANLNSTLAGIFGNGTATVPKYNFVNLINRVPIGSKKGVTQYTWSEGSGMVYSGVYDTSAESNGKRDLVILLSNMAGNTQHADLVDKIGGFAVDLNPKTSKLDQDVQLKAGTHHLLEFQLKNNVWDLLADNTVFTDDNRNGIGVPEPTSLGVMALGAVGLLARRRSRK